MLPYLQYWGKARPAMDASASWHPLAYHALDVAAVAQSLLEQDGHLRRWMAGLLRLGEAETSALMTFAAALHDLGKFSCPFQGMALPDLYLARTGKPANPPPGPRHDEAGLALWRRNGDRVIGTILGAEDAENWADALEPVLAAALGHHGQPAGASPSGDVRGLFRDGARDDAIAFAQDAGRLLLPEHIASRRPPLPKEVRLASWAVAGFVTVSDWIGSHQPSFPYRAPGPDLSTYFEETALPYARRAVAMAGLIGPPAAAKTAFAMLFPNIPRPTTVQHWADTATLPAGPSLVLIEDATGSGKTEAALVLVHRLIAAGRMRGMFTALPTQATANAMYDRLAPVYRRLFVPSGSPPSLVLSHGARDRHDGFVDSILPFGEYHEGAYGIGDTETETASATCAAWIAADRRRAMLADVGVGTVDQAILSVLPRRFQALRLFGLAQRVLVLDEVHAYDVYVSREIESLLEFHAALGGSVILLSATLPSAHRTRLLHAFARGRRCATGAETQIGKLSDAYPLVSVLADDGVATWSPDTGAPRREPRMAGSRSVPVRMTEDGDAIVAKIAEAARAGGSVCWVRNTVADALEAYDDLRGRLDQVRLLHARFTIEDRLAIERDVVTRFGRDGLPRTRAGHVLVATQVVEQSLDLDFDFMVTDLAPIDLIIQRAGRLCRHDRGPRPVAPVLWVYGPAPVQHADAGWYRHCLRRAAFVYPHHGILWLTAKVLAERGVLVKSDETRALVEAVYEEGARNVIPEALHAVDIRALGADEADRSTAAFTVLKARDGYVRESGPWDEDSDISTRLGEPQTTVRLARWQNGVLKPWSEAAPTERDPWRPWRLSEVRVRAYALAGAAEPSPDIVAAVATVTAAWPKADRGAVVLPLVHDPGTRVWRGRGVAASGTIVNLSYESSCGLRIEG